MLKPIGEYRSSRSLRSDNFMLLSIPDFNMVHCGRQAARLWKNVAVEIQKTNAKSEFKNKLKTHLFKAIL